VTQPEPRPEPLTTEAVFGALRDAAEQCHGFMHFGPFTDCEAAICVRRFAVSRATPSQPEGGLDGGDCLMCGHRMLLAVWSLRDPSVGVCFPCRQAAEPLRGPHSKARGCLCPCEEHTEGGCINCHGFGFAWGAGWDPRSNRFDTLHDHAAEVAAYNARLSSEPAE
jgi:hypothetical protein